MYLSFLCGKKVKKWLVLLVITTMMLSFTIIQPLTASASNNTITNGIITVTIDTTFPIPLQYMLNSSGAILYGADANGAHTININGNSYAASVTNYSKSTDTAAYTLHVAGFSGGIDITYQFVVSGNMLVRSITGITGAGEPAVRTIKLESPVLRVKSSQGGKASFNIDTGMDTQWHETGASDEKINLDVASSGMGTWDTSWPFLNTPTAVGSGYNNLYDVPFTIKVENYAGEKCAALYDREYYYRFMAFKPGVWFESKTYIGEDINNSGSIEWQDGAIWLRTQLPQMPANLSDFFNKGGAWQQIHLAFQGREDVKVNTDTFIPTSFPVLAAQIRQLYYQTDGVPQSIEGVGWQGKGHDWCWPDWTQQVNPGLGGRMKMDQARMNMAKYGGDLSFHVNADDCWNNSAAYNDNILAKDSNNQPFTSWALGGNYAYAISHMKDVLNGTAISRIDNFISSYWAPLIIYQDVMLDKMSEYDGYYGAAEHYAKMGEVDRFKSYGTNLTTEYYQPSNFRNGNFMGKVKKSFSHIDNFITAGKFMCQNNNYGSNGTRSISYDLLWASQLAGNYRSGNLNAQENLGANQMIQDTFTHALMSAYMRNYEPRKFIDDSDKYEVQWGNDLIARVDKKSDWFTLKQGAVTIADGSDRFIPAPDFTRKIYVYTLYNKNKAYTLPQSWSGITKVNMYELTESGKAFIGQVDVVNGQVNIQTSAKVPYLLLPGVAGIVPKTGPVNFAESKSASASSAAGSNLAGNAVDGNNSTQWTSTQANGSWLDVDLGHETTFNRVTLREAGSNITSYRIQYFNGNSWCDIYSGTSIGSESAKTFPEVLTQRVRLYIDTAANNPSISEFEVYSDANLAITAIASASSNSVGARYYEVLTASDNTTYTNDIQASRAIDGTTESYWKANNETNGSWLQLDFTRDTKVSRAVISENGNNITSYKLQYWNGSTWADVLNGTSIGTVKESNFPMITTRKVRLYINSAAGAPSISEFKLYYTGGVQEFDTPVVPGTTVKVNDTSPRISKVGATYHANRGIGDLMDDVHNVNSTGCFKFTFEGTSIRWVSEKDIGCGEARVYIDGQLDNTINTYSPTRLVQEVVYEKTGLTDTTHTIMLECTSGNMILDAFEYVAGGAQTTQSLDTIVLKLNDNSSDIKKVGAMHHPNRGIGDYMDDVHNISGAGCYYEFTFKGTSIRWISEKDIGCGEARVYIDGQLDKIVSTYSATRLVQELVYEKTGLTDGTHTIKIENIREGTNCILDALEYTSRRYIQEFGGGSPGGWSRATGTGTVAVENNSLHVTGNSTSTIAVDGNSPSQTNGVYEFTVTPQNNEGRTGGIFRYNSPNSYVCIGYDIGNSWYWDNGTSYGLLTSSGPQLTSGNTYRIKIQFTGSNIKLWVDGVQYFDGNVTALPQTAGKIGVRSWGASNCYYDNCMYYGQ